MSFRAYVDHGWKLCRIKEREKGPRYSGWNKPERAVQSHEAEHIPGAGLMHAYSGTCALDIDDLDLTRAHFAKHGVDLDALLNADDAVAISSGTLNRAKLLFVLPGMPLPTKKVIKDKDHTLFELRCADAAGSSTVQDVLPPSIHPSGRQYEWKCGIAGDWRSPPPLPESLRALWHRMLGDIVPAGTSPAQELPQGNPDIEAAQRILAGTDPDCDYDTWIRLGMALEHDLGNIGYQLWNEWSSKGTKYPGEAALDSHWNSFGRSATPVTLGSFKRELTASKDMFDDLSGEDLDDDPFEQVAAARVAAMKLWTLKEIQERPWPTWIVRDILPKAELSMVYGPSGAGKSFVVLDIALAVARGVPWVEHDVRQGGVLWLAAEAFGSMKPRTKAYAQANELTLDDLGTLPFYVVEQFSLNNQESVATLIEAVKETSLQLVVVDTLAAASGGANENSGEDMGAILDACRSIHYATGASVLLIHHSGKNVELGARGWSGIRAAVQAELRVDYDPIEGNRAITATKQRDGQDGLMYGFTLVDQMVGMDDRELPINSASVKVTGKIERAPSVEGDGNGRRPPKGVMEGLLWKAFLEMLPLNGDGVPKAVLVDQVARTIGDTETMKSTRKALSNAVTKLYKEGYFEIVDGMLRIPDADPDEHDDEVSDLI